MLCLSSSDAPSSVLQYGWWQLNLLQEHSIAVFPYWTQVQTWILNYSEKLLVFCWSVFTGYWSSPSFFFLALPLFFLEFCWVSSFKFLSHHYSRFSINPNHLSWYLSIRIRTAVARVLMFKNLWTRTFTVFVIKFIACDDTMTGVRWNRFVCLWNFVVAGRRWFPSSCNERKYKSALLHCFFVFFCGMYIFYCRPKLQCYLKYIFEAMVKKIKKKKQQNLLNTPKL